MQLKVEGLNLDNRAELMLAAGGGIDFASSKTTQGDVTLTVGAPYANPYPPTGGQFATLTRMMALSSQAVLASGTLNLTAITLPAGIIITSISFMTGTTAASGPTNQLFGLYDSARNLLATTVNDGATAWNASTVKTLALTPGTFTTTYDGLHYLGCMVTVSTTIPTSIGFSGSSNTLGLTPILNGSSTTGLTTALPASAAAITAAATVPYAYIS